MRLAKGIGIGILVGGWLGLVWATGRAAETKADGATSEGWVAKGDWQRRVLQGGPTTQAGPEQAKVDQQRTAQRSPSREAPVRTASRIDQTGPEEIAPGMEQVAPEALPTEDARDLGAMGAAEMYVPESGGYYLGAGGQPGGVASAFSGLRAEWWARDLSILLGAQAFKGPFDQGRNGNFGLHEGVNFGSPLGGPRGWGYQVGFLAAQSNFSGDRANSNALRRADRDQLFFTAGVFHRALCGGIQWGVTFDLLRDTYYAKADMGQIRSEIGYLFAGGRGEIGYWGAYGVNDDEVVVGGRNVSLEPTDLFAFYYRRHFEGAGEGRFWGGFTGHGDGLLGADVRVPLGRSWAVEGGVNYLIPREGRGDGQDEESWGLGVRLVWFFGQPAHCAQNSAYRPMLNVADNSLFMVDYTRP